MEGTMKVAVMKGIRKMEFEQWPIPQIKDDEVLVKINHVGVCGSDLHFFEAGRIGNWIVDSDLVLGHESGGTVVEVGSKVEHLKVGDRVALEPGVFCGECEMCKKVITTFARRWTSWRFLMSGAACSWSTMHIRQKCASSFRIM